MELKDLEDTKKELVRFKTRLDNAIKRIKEDEYALCGCKETGAVKRAALDLKMELTKITR
jgi:hypothetical protein